MHSNIMGEKREEKEYNHWKVGGEAQKYREIERGSSKIIGEERISRRKIQ